MKSANGNIFRVTGPLRGESTGHWWIPPTKASDAELWAAPGQTIEQTIETPVIWDPHLAHYDVTVMDYSWQDDSLIVIQAETQFSSD